MDFLKSMKSMIKPKTSQIQSMIRYMIAEVNSRISVEKNSLNYVDKAIYRYLNEKNKDALIQASQRYVVASRRISGLELIKNAIQKVQEQAQYLKEQPPPVDLIDPLNTICWAGYFLKFESVKNFSDRVLVYAYGRNTVSTFSNSNTLSQDVRDCFYNEEVNENDYRKLLYDYARSHGLDNSTIDEIIGARPSTTIQLNYPSLGDINLQQNQFQTLPTNQILYQNMPQNQHQTAPSNQFNQPPNFYPQSQVPQQPQFPTSVPNFQQQPPQQPGQQQPQLPQPPQFTPTSQPPQFTPTSQPPQFTPTTQSTQFNTTSHLPEFDPNSQAPQFSQNSQGPQFTPTSQAPQFNPNSQGPQFIPTSHPPQFTPTSQPPKYTPPPENDNEDIDTNQNQQDKKINNINLEKKPTLSSASSFSYYPGSTPVEQSYKFNENLLPLVQLQPFEKENWPYLQESIALATSYKNEKKNQV